MLMAEDAGCSVSEYVRSALIYRTVDLPEAVSIPKSRKVMKGAKTCEVHIMLSATERRVLDEKAEALGCTLSQLVRRAAIEGDIRVTSLDMTVLQEYVRELRKEGVNLNQIAYFLNAKGIDGYVPREVDRMLIRVRKAIENAEDLIEEIKEDFETSHRN